jgi:hypothetical protein
MIETGLRVHSACWDEAGHGHGRGALQTKSNHKSGAGLGRAGWALDGSKVHTGWSRTVFELQNSSLRGFGAFIAISLERSWPPLTTRNMLHYCEA